MSVLPFSQKLQPESEDSLCWQSEEPGDGNTIAWIRFPHLSNSQDCQPWLMDSGVRLRWIQHINEIDGARLVILPGSKNTVADLQWLRETGIEIDVKRAAQRGVPIVGICAGYQMLGESVGDREGVAGDQGVLPGLNLLPVQTTFSKTKEVLQVYALWRGERWQAYAGWTESAMAYALGVRLGGDNYYDGHCSVDRYLIRPGEPRTPWTLREASPGCGVSAVPVPGFSFCSLFFYPAGH